MSKYPLYSAMIALSTVLAAPVLAQTDAPASGAPAAPPAATSTANPPGLMGHSTSQEYRTADQQVRASKLIGSSVYNDQKEKIGSIDELLLDQHNDVSSAVLSVGGFLGIGSKLVKVPYSELHVAGDMIMMPGASKDELTHMPSYKYAG